MSPTLPERPSLEWLRKAAKERARRDGVKLADAQRDLARAYGFASWRRLKAHVEQPSADDVVKAFFHRDGSGRIDEVRDALDAAPQLVQAVGPHPFWGGRPQALHVSVETGRRDVFELLLERGADVDGRNDQYDHWSPLMLAIHRGRTELRDELLRHGAQIGLVEALMLADDARVDALLDRSGLPAVVPNGGSLVAFARTTHAVDRLLARGASIDAKDRWGSAPIDSLSALGKRGTPLVQHLIARGAAAAPHDYARLGDLASLASLYETDPAVAHIPAVLLAAVDFSHHELVEWLLARGADVNARAERQSRQTPLHAAAWNGDLRMVQLLIAAGADPSLLDEEHHTTAREWAEVSRRVTNNPECDAVAECLRTLT